MKFFFQKKQLIGRLINNGGFSLIEMVVVIALFAVIMTAVFVNFDNELRTKEHITNTREKLETVQVIFTVFNQDIEQAFVSHDSLEGQLNRQQTGMKATQTELLFSTMSNFSQKPQSRQTDQHLVAYYVENKEGKATLFRASSKQLTDSLERPETATALIDDVIDFQLRYFDSLKDEWVLEWDTESVSSQGRLPYAVEVTLEIKRPSARDFENEGFVFQRVIPIKMYQKAINF